MPELDLTQFGGKALAQGPGGEIAWNFGLAAPPASMPDDHWLIQGTQAGDIVWDFGSPQEVLARRARERAYYESLPDLYTVRPDIKGAWDRKTIINRYATFKKATGQELPVQRQPRGTCVGRGAAYVCNLLQGMRIAAGEPFEFKPASHAWIYGGARTRGGLLGSRSDGAVGSDALLWCGEKGLLTQEEAHDTNYASDDVAVEWGYSGIPSNLMPTAADNLVQGVAKITSAAMLADAFAAGLPAVATIASSFGFAMTRDANGFCRHRGVWQHQMSFGYLCPQGFGCTQSWGHNVPDGPLLPGCPDFVFGVLMEDADRMIRQGDSMLATSLVGWQGDLIPWTF